MTQSLITELFALEVRRREIIQLLELDGEVFNCARCSDWKTRNEFYPDAKRVNGIYPTCRKCKIRNVIMARPKPLPEPPPEPVVFEDNVIVGRCNQCRRVLKRNDLYLDLPKCQFVCDTCITELFIDPAQLRKSQAGSKPPVPVKPGWSGREWMV